MGVHIIQFPESARPSACSRLPDRRGPDERRSLITRSATPSAAHDGKPSTYSPIRPLADRLADVIGHHVEWLLFPRLFDASPVKTAVARVVTAFFPYFDFQNDKGSQATNRKPIVVHLDTSSFSFDYAPPSLADASCHGSNHDSEGFVTCEKNVPARREN